MDRTHITWKYEVSSEGTTSLGKEFLEGHEWNAITQETYPLYIQYLARLPERGSEYSFLGIYIWKELYGLQYIANEELLFLRTRKSNYHWAPLGHWSSIDWGIYDLPNMHLTFQFVPEQLMLIWKEYYHNAIEIIEDRNSWDYIYDAQELAELSGRKYAKKKNHLNNFIKTTTEYRIESITSSNALRVLEHYELWAKEQERFTPLLQAEYHAICSVLRSWSSFEEIEGIYIAIADDIVAFAIGEALSSSTFVIQVEKALQDTRGLYQLVNKAFAERIVEQGYLYINRADDSGIAGLRQAKESYYPIEYIKKYTISFI